MVNSVLFQLFRSFLATGAFAFGGGYAMVPLVQREVVEKRQWLTAEEFLDALAVAQSSPGAIAVNVAVCIGYRVAGLGGLVAAALGAVLPSFLVTLLIVVFFLRFEANPLVQRFFAVAPGFRRHSRGQRRQRTAPPSSRSQ